jgi:hypothetical protein
MRLQVFFLSLILLGSSASAFAAPGELNSVVLHCGPPGAESRETSQITGEQQRTLIYDNSLYLHFQPVATGWSFTTAWKGHLPMTRGEIENHMPCFRQAMQEAAAAVPVEPGIDPALAAQSVPPRNNNNSFGVPHLPLIVFLIITLLVFLIVPSARARRLARQQTKPVEHIYRKPNLEEYVSPTLPPRPLDRDLD